MSRRAGHAAPAALTARAPGAQGRVAQPAGGSPRAHGRTLAAVALALACGLLVPSAARPTESAALEAAEHVLVLHGLARSAGSMGALADRLRAAGFVVHVFDYPSTRHTPEELVALVAAEEARCCRTGVARLHYVAHSLGGILVRAHLERDPPPNLGRVVLLAPPNRGSEWVDVLADLALFEAALGPTAVALGTDADSLPNSIGPPRYPLGIIAGTASINPVGSAILPGEDDGTVSVASARLEGATDFLTVEATHTFIMQDAEVARQVVTFLRTGHFDHDAP